MNELIATDIQQAQDVIRALLEDKRSPRTKEGYMRDIRHFFTDSFGVEPTNERVLEFLANGRIKTTAAIMAYKSRLVARGYKPNTVNRKLTAIKSLVSFAYEVGLIDYEVKVRGEKAVVYADTSGPNTEQVQSIFKQPDLTKPHGIRDRAILSLLWTNALRRSEVQQANLEDYDREARKLWISGKGKGGQKEPVTLSESTCKAINAWLEVRGEADTPALFTTCDSVYGGRRLSGKGIYRVVRGYAEQAGIEKRVSPHRIRHSSITTALELTHGDVTKVQRLSRHAKVETLMIYNDNRVDYQGEISEMLSHIDQLEGVSE